jgi:hypothetical protein
MSFVRQFCYLAPKCAKLRRPASTETILNLTAAAARPLMVGLKHRNGDWTVSYPAFTGPLLVYY